MKSTILSIVSLFALSAGLQAQGTVWSLEDCIKYGLNNHGSMRVYANEQEKATQRSKEALSAYLPQVTASVTLDDNVKRQTSIIPAGAFSPTETRIQFGTQFSSVATAQVDQVIYDQALITGLKANTYNIQQAQVNNEQNKETVVYNIATAYYQVFVYKQQAALLKENLDKYNKLLVISQLQVSKGVAKQVDLDRIQVNTNNTQSQLNLAESNYELSLNKLKNAMGLDLKTVLDLKAIDIPEDLAETVAADSFNVSQRYDYKLQKINISLYDIEKNRIRFTAFPRLTGYARYGSQAQGNELSTYYNRWFDYSAIGLKLSMNVFDGLKRNAQYKQALYNKQNAEENLKINVSNYEVQFQNAKTQLLKAQTNLSNDRRNLQLAKDVFETTSLQYQNGVVLLSDWLNSETSMKEAQSNYLNSMYNFYIARIDLEKSKGNLLSYYKQ